MMRSVLAGFLCLLHAFQVPMAYAMDLALSSPYFHATRDYSPARFSERVGEISRQRYLSAAAQKVGRARMLQQIERGQRAANSKPGQFVVHHTQTFVVLCLLAAAEALKRNHELRPLQTPEEQLPNSQLAIRAGKEMLNSFEVMAGLLGGGAAMLPLTKPLAALQQVLADGARRPIMARLMGSGLSSFITFVGFEVGAELWQEATLLLDPYSNEIEISKTIKISDVLANTGTPEQKAVGKKMILNVFKILAFVEWRLTLNMYSNTWNHRILTGEFLTLFTSMVAGSTLAGSLLAPGAGTLVGFFVGVLGGVAGGLASMWIPEPMKRAVTDGIRDRRIDSGFDALSYMTIGMDRDFLGSGLSEKIQISRFESYQLSRFKTYQEARLKVRQGILNRYTEQIYDAQMRRQEAESILLKIDSLENQGIDRAVSHINLDSFLDTGSESEIEIKESDIKELQRKYTQEYHEALAAIQNYGGKMLDLQIHEVNTWAKYAYADNALEKVRGLAQQEIYHQSNLHMALRQFVLGLLPEDPLNLSDVELSNEAKAELMKSSEAYLNMVYLLGFDENAF